MEQNPKHDILVLIKEVYRCAYFEDFSAINTPLAELRQLLIKTKSKLKLTEEVCQLMVDTYSLLAAHGVHYPSLLTAMKAGCYCNDQIAVWENSDAVKMQQQTLKETLAALDKMSPNELQIFIEAKDRILLPDEADMELLIYAERRLKRFKKSK
jgi:hypothetical protein